jgi:WhiB family transcriptional regulator, redox-sensing transcriptional regulator
MRKAECAYVDPDLWYPHEKGDPGIQAKRICRRCPVKIECLAYALDNDERHGIWGGLSAQERAKPKLSEQPPLTALLSGGLGYE